MVLIFTCYIDLCISFFYAGGLHRNNSMLTYKISQKFEDLWASVCNYCYSNEKITTKKLSSLIIGASQKKPIFEDKQTSEHDFNEDSNILLVLRHHVSFFNFELLKTMVKIVNYSTSEMEDYEVHFREYARALAVPTVDRKGHRYFRVRLDDTFKSCRRMYIDLFKEDLCKLLRGEVRIETP